MILSAQEKALGIIILENGLKGPALYDTLTEQQVDDLTNGCGPKGLGPLVPERMFSASFKEPCRCHDIMFLMGYDKKFADQVFYENCMERTKRCFFALRPAAEWAAFMYYLAVKNGGAGAYARACEDGKALGLSIERA